MNWKHTAFPFEADGSLKSECNLCTLKGFLLKGLSLQTRRPRLTSAQATHGPHDEKAAPLMARTVGGGSEGCLLREGRGARGCNSGHQSETLRGSVSVAEKITEK